MNSENKTTLQEDIKRANQGWIEHCLLIPGYKETTKKVFEILYKPEFTIKDVQTTVKNLTYRKINDWDEKSLITGSRNNLSAGWRKFSLIDIVKIHIITDLRKFGFNTERIRDTLKILSEETQSQVYDPLNKQLRNLKFLKIDHYIVACFSGSKMLILIDESGNPNLLEERAAVAIQYCFKETSHSPFLTLPLFSYVEKISVLMKETAFIKKDIKFNEEIANLFHSSLSDKEKRILEIIRNNDYEEVKIIKPNGNEIAVKAKTRNRGSFLDADIINSIHAGDYQNVTVSILGGKKIGITREEIFKV